MTELLKKAKAAKAAVSLLTTARKNVALEAMADASYDLTDTYINACLSGKYTRDQESFEMIELTMENIVLDMTFIFDFGQLGSTLTKAINNHTPFISTFESLKPVVVSEIDKFVNGGY